MLKYPFLTALVALAACTSAPDAARIAQNDVALTATPCDRADNPVCIFINSPVPLRQKPVRLFMRKNIFFPTAAPLEFIDARGRRWIAPESTLTDGASIPTLFVPMIGNPRSPEFINAAAMHDAYCGIGNEEGPKFHVKTWQEVHRMFYDALRVGGTPSIKAKIMYSAVYLGGPRWTGTRAGTLVADERARIEKRRSRYDRPLIQAGIPERLLIGKFREVMAFIRANDPSIAELESFLIREEHAMFDAVSLFEGEHSLENVPPEYEYPDYGYPGFEDPGFEYPGYEYPEDPTGYTAYSPVPQ
jgi:hypothetical protein